MSEKRLVVLISGNGSNLQAILDACANGTISAKIACVLSNQANAYGIQRAQKAGVPTIVLPSRGRVRSIYDLELANRVSEFAPDYILLAGWMRLLSDAFLKNFPGRVINLHPALPGKFPGLHAIERAYAAFHDGEISRTGVMIHYVPDEGVDCGPVILQAEVPINPQDSLEELEHRIHDTEHQLYVEALKRICNQGGNTDAKSNPFCFR